jgi:hypothetical protein
LAGILVDQSIELAFTGYRVLLSVADEESIKTGKRKKTAIVPSDRVVAIEVCTDAGPDPKALKGEVMEA